MKILLMAAMMLAIAASDMQACAWDRDTDTLRDEFDGLPGTVRIITGRFERNPPAYYEMRLERVTAEIGNGSTDLLLFDDAGVACDRLHRGEEAIAWMVKKKALIDALDAGSPEYSTHLYRYHANIGTFQVHKWLRGGAKSELIDEVKNARANIAKAIEINPDAHFGREKYQLMALDWILMLKSGEKFPDDQFPLSLIPVSTEQVGDMDHRGSYGPDESAFDSDAVEGLAGLIALGDAWESVDVFGTLFLALKSEENNSIAELALLRVRELESGGKSSLTGKPIADDINGEAGTSMDRGTPRKFFSDAREEAEKWHLARQQYMSIQFGLGRHSDTHDDFWGSFAYEDEAPTPPDQWSMKTRVLVNVGVGLLVAFVGLGLLAWLVVKLVRKIQSSFQGPAPVSS